MPTDRVLRNSNGVEKRSNANSPQGQSEAKPKTAETTALSEPPWKPTAGKRTASTQRSGGRSKRGATNWLKTSEAAAALGWSPKFLKSQREEKGGFLTAGIHFLYGPTLRASIVWDVDLVRAAFHRRGLEARQEVSA